MTCFRRASTGGRGGRGTNRWSAVPRQLRDAMVEAAWAVSGPKRGRDVEADQRALIPASRDTRRGRSRDEAARARPRFRAPASFANAVGDGGAAAGGHHDTPPRPAGMTATRPASAPCCARPGLSRFLAAPDVVGFHAKPDPHASLWRPARTVTASPNPYWRYASRARKSVLSSPPMRCSTRPRKTPRARPRASRQSSVPRSRSSLRSRPSQLPRLSGDSPVR